MNTGKWIYINVGKYDTSYTGMAKNQHGWWYMKEGVLDRTFSGTVTLGGKTYTIKNGQVV